MASASDFVTFIYSSKKSWSKHPDHMLVLHVVEPWVPLSLVGTVTGYLSRTTTKMRAPMLTTITYTRVLVPRGILKTVNGIQSKANTMPTTAKTGLNMVVTGFTVMSTFSIQIPMITTESRDKLMEADSARAATTADLAAGTRRPCGEASPTMIILFAVMPETLSFFLRIVGSDVPICLASFPDVWAGRDWR